MSRRSSEVTNKSRESYEEEDRISKLHETVICYILSRLNSVDAVRTSVLSKDWEYKWTLIYNINIDSKKLYCRSRTDLSSPIDGKKLGSFTNFVNRTLCSVTYGLTSFRLICRGDYLSTNLTQWISAALRRNVESFQLETDQNKSVLPETIVNNSSLRRLKLVKKRAPFCIFNAHPCHNYFPNLTYLYLKNVEIRNELSSTDDRPLVFSFPVLKTFELIQCKWSYVSIVEIYSPALCTFKCEACRHAGINDYSIKICGAKIEKFTSCGGFPENIIMYESTVLNAAFTNHSMHLQCNGKLLNEFTSVITLELSFWVCENIAHSCQGVRLDRLQRLIIYVGCDVKLLFELLHSAPSLKFLEINSEKEGYEDGEIDSEELDCEELDSVPSCVVSKLEEVTFKYACCNAVINIGKFLLKNGVMLKKFFIVCYYLHDLIEIVEQLSKAPIASSTLEIVSVEPRDRPCLKFV